MADVNRGKRPLSPHLSVFDQSWTGTLSILHRITGVVLGAGAVLVAWWFLGLASGPDYFNFVDGLLTSWLGGLVLIGCLAALCYHFVNGIRHLMWDAGYGLDLESVRSSWKVTVGASAALTLLALLIFWL